MRIVRITDDVSICPDAMAGVRVVRGGGMGVAFTLEAILIMGPPVPLKSWRMPYVNAPPNWAAVDVKRLEQVEAEVHATKEKVERALEMWR